MDKVTQLEETIEDLEDEVSSLKRKLASREEELEKALSSSREEKSLKEELFSQKEQLAESKNTIELKDKSLAFIQEVLTAQKVSTDDVKTQESNLNKFENFIVDDLYNFFIDNADVLGDIESYKHFFEEDYLRWKLFEQKHWLKNKKTIAFVGEFSAGKTSIVNRLLKQNNPNVPELPVSTKATTAIPTYISGGMATQFSFFSPDNILKSISENTFKRVNKEILAQIEGVSSLIKYFVMSYENQNLSKLSILDTPGFTSNDSEDSIRTIEVINECDALFWVIDVNAGTVNRSSLKTIKEYLHKPLYIIINKIDTKADSEVDAVEKLVLETFKKEGVSIENILRFGKDSSVDELLAEINHIPYNKEENFLSDLLKFLNEKKANLKQRLDESNSRKNDIQNEIIEWDKGFQNQINDLYDYSSDIKRKLELNFNNGFFSNYVKMSEEDANSIYGMVNYILEDPDNENYSLINKLKMCKKSSVEENKNMQSEMENNYKLKIIRRGLSSKIDKFEQLSKLFINEEPVLIHPANYCPIEKKSIPSTGKLLKFCPYCCEKL